MESESQDENDLSEVAEDTPGEADEPTFEPENDDDYPDTDDTSESSQGNYSIKIMISLIMFLLTLI